jgi:rod shape-determining protein MreD
MKWFIFVVLLAISTVLQASLIEFLAIQNITPNLLLILMVYFAVVFREHEQLIASFAIGLAAGIISSTIGPCIVSYLLVGTVLSNLNQYLIIKTKLYQGFAIFVCGIIANLIIMFITNISQGAATENFWAFIISSPLYSGVIGPFFLLPIALIMNIKALPKKKNDI